MAHPVPGPPRACRGPVRLLSVLAAVTFAGCSFPVASPGTSASAPVTASPTPSVPPATGPEIVRDGLVLRAPASFGEGREREGATRSLSDDSCAAVEVSDFAGKELPRTQLIRAFTKQKLWSSPPEELPDVTVAGWSWFHLHGWGRGDMSSDDLTIYGTYRDGRIISIWLERNLLNECGLPQGDIDRQWASVLATVRWS